MGILPWIGQQWFALLQTVGILGGLLFTALTLRKDERARQISNSIAITEQHRQIWKELYLFPELSRVLLKERNLVREPASQQEELFVRTLIVHLSTAFRAMKHDEFVRLEGLERDVRSFFSLPVPKAVWRKVQPFHDKDFANFVEAQLK